jgi:SAM-dependent methyltransferase
MENVNDLADLYDVIHQNEQYHKNRGEEKNEIDYISKLIPPRARILDAGCGFGLPFLKYFADNNYRITGTDISLESLKIAKKFAPDANLYVKDTSKLDFDKNTFDLIICLYSIMHLDIEKQKKAFNKIYEMLIPGGYFRINFASKDYTGHDEFAGLRTFNGHSLPCYHTTPEKYEKIFLDLGFEIIDSKTKFTGVEEEIDLKNRKEIIPFWMLVRKPIPPVSIRFKMNSHDKQFSSLREFFQYEDSILENCYSSKEWEADLSIAIEKKLILDRLVETWDEFQQEYNYYLFSYDIESAEKFLHFVDVETGLYKSINKAQQYGFTTERFIVDCSTELFNKSILLLPNK